MKKLALVTLALAMTSTASLSADFPSDYQALQSKMAEVATQLEAGDDIEGCYKLGYFQAKREQLLDVHAESLDTFTFRNLYAVAEQEAKIVAFCSGEEVSLEEAAEAARYATQIFWWE